MAAEMSREEALQKWDDEVWSNLDELDPDEEYAYSSMAFGYFLALGFSAEEAREMVLEGVT